MSKRNKAATQVSYGDHHPEAIEAMIIHCWIAKPKASQDKIAKRINEEFGTQINGDTVKAAIKAARARGWLQIAIPEAKDVETRIYAKARIKNAATQFHVMNSDSAQHIAAAIASHVHSQIVNELKDRTEIHIGFFGGRTNSFVAQILVELLRRDADCRIKRKSVKNDDIGERRLVLHALVGVLDSDDPETDPNSFPVYFIQHRDVIEQHLCRKLAFKKLAMPGLVTNGDFELFRQQSLAVRHAFEKKQEYDIIIASCGHAGHRYTLTDYIEAGLRDCPELVKKFDEMKKYFKDKRVLGDIAWHPVLPNGTPVDLSELPLRVATLFTLPELKELAARGGTPQIILAIGPCSDPECPETKKELLRWVIESKPVLANHIFVDRRSAADYLDDDKND